MNKIHEKLISAYTVLVLAEIKNIEDVPETVVTLEDGKTSTIRVQVEIKVAEKTIEVLE